MLMVALEAMVVIADGTAAVLPLPRLRIGHCGELPFLRVDVWRLPMGAGLRLLPWTATLFVVAPVAGALVNRVGER